jgi:hypothetical protein
MASNSILFLRSSLSLHRKTFEARHTEKPAAPRMKKGRRKGRPFSRCGTNDSSAENDRMKIFP